MDKRDPEKRPVTPPRPEVDQKDEVDLSRELGVSIDPDQMLPDDDLLPRRVVGEERISEEVRQSRANPERRPPIDQSDAYNLSPDAVATDPYGEDVSGEPPLEEEATARDISPDHFEGLPDARSDDEADVDARPSRDLRPIKPDELPEG